MKNTTTEEINQQPDTKLSTEIIHQDSFASMQHVCLHVRTKLKKKKTYKQWKPV